MLILFSFLTYFTNHCRTVGKQTVNYSETQRCTSSLSIFSPAFLSCSLADSSFSVLGLLVFLFGFFFFLFNHQRQLLAWVLKCRLSRYYFLRSAILQIVESKRTWVIFYRGEGTSLNDSVNDTHLGLGFYFLKHQCNVSLLFNYFFLHGLNKVVNTQNFTRGEENHVFLFCSFF